VGSIDAGLAVDDGRPDKHQGADFFQNFLL
jgi:hypothetical protein